MAAALIQVAFCASIMSLLGLTQLLVFCPVAPQTPLAAPAAPIAEEDWKEALDARSAAEQKQRASLRTDVGQNVAHAAETQDRWVKHPSQSGVNFSLDQSQYPFYCDPMKRMFVINLEGDRGRQRREHAMEQFRQAGISELVEWFPGVDGRVDEVLAEELGRHCPCDSQLALSMSHRRIYEKIVEEKIPCATIFEDDVMLASNFSTRLRKATPYLPPFDVLQLGWCPGGKKVAPPDDQTSIPTIKHGWPGPCMHAYTVSLQGAFLLKWTNTPVRNNADGNMGPGNQRKSSSPQGVRLQLSNHPGDLPGTYWHLNISLAWQTKEIKEGAARRLGEE